MSDSNKKENAKSKKAYRKPSVKSEPLMGFGALCNGMKVGGRKVTDGAPDFCGATKLLS